MVAKKASKSGSKSGRSTSKPKGRQDFFGWSLGSWLEGATISGKTSAKARLIVAGQHSDHKGLDSMLSELIPTWQQASLKEAKELIRLAGQDGPIWVVRPRSERAHPERDRGLYADNSYSIMRDLLGRWIQEIEHSNIRQLKIEFYQADDDETLGALVGLDLGAYLYKRALNGEPNLLPTKLLIEGVKKAQLDQAVTISKAVNIARHLVNSPGNELNPKSYSEAIVNLVAGLPNMKAEVWDENRLKKEKMELILAVGQAAGEAPCMVKVSYRPKKTAKSNAAPVAFVGKGITFDSGGLDIKPAAGMRLMKKDMGGSAALVGFLYWLANSDHSRDVDVYLPLAENAISGNAFRPGDIYTARNGKRVEIHNTDAEGRLILADALAVASEAKPEAIVCVATLTGAAKVAIGTDLAAYFATDEKLADRIEEGSKKYGDWIWRLPLFDGYRSYLRSNTADINHCANTPFAGSITAALFLTEFVDHLPFLHLDIYAWNDKAKGALREQGGSGQIVQALIGFMETKT